MGYDLMKMSLNGVELVAPTSFWMASPEARAKVSNGCGPANSWIGHLVPDWVGGIDFSPACDIHDWMYAVGRDLEDKAEADQVLLVNLLRLIRASSVLKVLKVADREAAFHYYKAVSDFGEDAFFAGKEAMRDG